jgi:hypothetical protein
MYVRIVLVQQQPAQNAFDNREAHDPLFVVCGEATSPLRNTYSASRIAPWILAHVNPPRALD